MGLRDQIPSHIYDRAQDADLGKPDFYVGPTIAQRKTPNGSPGATHRNENLQRRMDEAKAATEMKVEHTRQLRRMESRERRKSVVAQVARLFTRVRLGKDPTPQ